MIINIPESAIERAAAPMCFHGHSESAARVAARGNLETAVNLINTAGGKVL